MTDCVVEMGFPQRLAIVTAKAALRRTSTTSPQLKPEASPLTVPETAEPPRRAPKEVKTAIMSTALLKPIIPTPTAVPTALALSFAPIAHAMKKAAVRMISISTTYSLYSLCSTWMYI